MQGLGAPARGVGGPAPGMMLPRPQVSAAPVIRPGDPAVRPGARPDLPQPTSLTNLFLVAQCTQLLTVQSVTLHPVCYSGRRCLTSSSTVWFLCPEVFHAGHSSSMHHSGCACSGGPPAAGVPRPGAPPPFFPGGPPRPGGPPPGAMPPGSRPPMQGGPPPPFYQGGPPRPGMMPPPGVCTPLITFLDVDTRRKPVSSLAQQTLTCVCWNGRGFGVDLTCAVFLQFRPGMPPPPGFPGFPPRPGFPGGPPPGAFPPRPQFPPGQPPQQ